MPSSASSAKPEDYETLELKLLLELIAKECPVLSDLLDGKTKSEIIIKYEQATKTKYVVPADCIPPPQPPETEDGDWYVRSSSLKE